MTNETGPKLSVILPCFNGAATIAVQLEALTGQHWPGGWELIVVNNGSTDHSMQVVEAYRGRIPGLRIVQAHVPHTPRLGVPHSYNTGIGAAAGDAFVFCEADDEVAPGWLLAMGHALRGHDFVAARMDHRKLNADWLHPSDGDGYQSAGLSHVDCHPHLPYASGCSFGMRRSLYEAVGALSTAFASVHDTEYCWRLQLAGFRLRFVPDALVYYREKSDPQARFRQGHNWGRDFTLLLHRYGLPRRRFAMLRQLVSVGRLLPAGVQVLLLWTFKRPRARPLLAQWVWNVGWSTGKLRALVDESALLPGGEPGNA